MNAKHQLFLQRLNRSGKPQAALEARLSELFQIVDSFSGKAELVKANRNLSADGKRAEMHALVGQGYLRFVDTVRTKLDPAKNHIKARRAAILPTEPDKTDVIGEMRRAEIRAHIRALPIEQRVTFLASTDPQVVDAILHAPAMLSGLPEDQHRHVVDQYIERNHADELREIEALEEQIEVVEAAVAVAHQDIQFASDLDPGDLRYLATASEKAA